MKVGSVLFFAVVVAAFVAISASFSFGGVAFADQGGSGGDADSGDDAADTDDKPTTRQDDDRLPPVLPGEEVVTETGQKMRVWSSAGPVPKNLPPTPQTFNGNGYGGPAVIVDGRGFAGR